MSLLSIEKRRLKKKRNYFEGMRNINKWVKMTVETCKNMNKTDK